MAPPGQFDSLVVSKRHCGATEWCCSFLHQPSNLGVCSELQLDSAEMIISRFANAGLTANELVALMAAHSVAGANVDNAPGIAYVLMLYSKEWSINQFF